MLIGLTGKKRCGKNTVGTYLWEKHRYQNTSFALPIKSICKIFGFSYDQLEGSLKETMDEFWEITPRKFMQIIGTEMFRSHFRDDVWLKMMELELANLNASNVAITDVRFDNEAKFIKDNGGLIVHIIRDSNTQEDSHSSERGISPEFVDYVIYNNEKITDLFSSVEEMLRVIQ